jgi:hypothetical protein
LRELDSEALHLRAQRQRILPQRDVRLVSQAMDPTHAVDGPAFDVFQLVTLRPVEALVETPVGTVERVGMKANLHESLLPA